MNKFMRGVFIVFSLTSMFLLGGCSALLDPGPPPSVYQLSPDLPAYEGGQKLNLQLAVSQPVTGDMLSTNRVVTRYPNGEIKTWKGVSWVSPAPVMMQGFLIQAYEGLNLFTAMPNASLGYSADYRLISDLREFTVVLNEDNKAAYVEIQFSAHLLNLQEGKSLGSFYCKKQVQIDGPGFDSVLAAFNSAIGSCIKEICDWSIGLLKNVGARNK